MRVWTLWSQVGKVASYVSTYQITKIQKTKMDKNIIFEEWDASNDEQNRVWQIWQQVSFRYSQCNVVSHKQKKTLPGIIRWSYHLVVFNIGLPKIRHKSLIFCKIRVLKTYIGTTCRRAWEAACKPERNEKFCSTTAFTDCGTWIQTACVCFSVKMTQDIYKTRIIIHSIMKNNNWK